MMKRWKKETTRGRFRNKPPISPTHHHPSDVTATPQNLIGYRPHRRPIRCRLAKGSLFFFSFRFLQVDAEKNKPASSSTGFLLRPPGLAQEPFLDINPSPLGFLLELYRILLIFVFISLFFCVAIGSSPLPFF